MKFPCARAAVLPFAKRGDDRSNNLVRLQQLFPRIVAADYEQPKRVSRGLPAPAQAHAHARPRQARHHPRDHAAPLVRFRALRPKMPWGKAAPHEQRLVSAQISKAIPSVNVYKRVYSGA